MKKTIAIAAFLVALVVVVQLPQSNKTQVPVTEVVEGQPEVPAQDEEAPLDAQSLEVEKMVNLMTNETETALNKLGYSLSNSVKVSVK